MKSGVGDYNLDQRRNYEKRRRQDVSRNYRPLLNERQASYSNTNVIGQNEENEDCNYYDADYFYEEEMPQIESTINSTNIEISDNASSNNERICFLNKLHSNKHLLKKKSTSSIINSFVETGLADGFISSDFTFFNKSVNFFSICFIFIS
jgi:hypothetical protein